MSNGNDHKNDDHRMEGHTYDGIVELDNALPTWWLNTFYITVFFAIGYFAYYSMGDGPGLVKEYETAKAAYDIAEIAQKGVVKLATEDELRALLKDQNRIKAGKEIFTSKCVACHGPQGQGGIGPNLADDYWIHGGKMTEIAATITNGVLDKGMPPWGSILKQDEIYSVVAFVKSLRGSNPPNAKGPEGVLVKE